MARKSRKFKDPQSPKKEDVHIYETAIYVRLSVEDTRKKESNSIGTQKAALLSYIQEQPDQQLHEIYEDLNYTGTNFDRPAFIRMISDIHAGIIDCVLVKDLSRFGRSFEETGHYLERVFPLLKVRFISVNDNYDSLTASLDENSLIVPLKNLFNEIYARDISRKVQSSFRLKRKRGEFCGSVVPYGYVKSGTALAVDEETAPVVRRIFRWILDGMSDAAIVQKLNGLKILPPNRYRFEKGLVKAEKYAKIRFWGKTTVKRISENPVYTGIMVQGKHKSNFLHGGGIVQTGDDEWTIVENTHPMIIDKSVFEAVKELRKNRKKNYEAIEKHIPQDSIFKGLIFCGDCKAFMIRRKLHRRNKDDEYCFLCSVYEQVDKNACTKKRVLEAEIKTSLYMAISRQVNFALEAERIISETRNLNTFQIQRNALEQHIGELQNKLQQNRRFRQSLREDLMDGVLSDRDYTLLKTNYDDEKNNFRQELDALLTEKQRQESSFSSENKWISQFRQFESERELSAQMVAALVERIEVYDGMRIEFHLRYCDEFEAILGYINEMRDELSE